MQTTHLDISTPSGIMKTELLVPEGSGPFGAVILFVDAGGQRAEMTAIGRRIAEMGYLTAIPDLFFRTGSALDMLPADGPRTMQAFFSVFADPERRKVFFEKYYAPTLDYAHLEEEVGPLLDALAARPDFNGKVGTTGYCLGGNASMRVATLFGDRITATASFHGGGLATDQPDSPHLRANDIKARVYVAGAIEDPSFTDEAKATLIGALASAGVDAKVETYPARHGFVVDDHATYDAAAAQRHDEALATLFGETLA